MKNKLVIVNISGCAELLSEPRRFSSESRISRCSRMKSESKRIQAYAAELALSYALSGSELAPPVYSYDAKGRPLIDGGFVSLSHTDGFAACAVSSSPVGVDIEAVRTISPRLAERILSPAERTLPHSADPLFLLKKWVAKEAYLKMTGEGISGGMNKLTATENAILKDGAEAARLFAFPMENCFCCLASVSDLPFEAEIL